MRFVNLYNSRLALFITIFIMPYGIIFSQNNNLSGNIKDSITGNSLASATIKLLLLPDSLLYIGTISTENGDFYLNNLPNENFLCCISYVGFKDKNLTINFCKSKESINLGNIKLSYSENMLAETEISAQRRITTKLDRTIYLIDSLILSGTTTTIDLLKKIPDLHVNQTYDNVNIKGLATTTVMLNGVLNPSSLKLKSIDPETIEKIEIITEPSSEYSSNIEGVVNIILKKEINEGYAVNIDLNWLAPLKRIETDASFDYGWKKIRYHFNYSCSFWGAKNKNYIYRNSTINNVDNVYISENLPEIYKEFNHYIENRIDYYINKNNFLNFSFVNNITPRNSTYNSLSITTINTQLTDSILTLSKNRDTQITGNYTIFYRRNLGKDGHKIEVNFNFHHMYAKYLSEVEEIKKNEQPYIEPFRRKEIIDATRYSYNLKADYCYPISENFSFNIGALGYFQTFKNSFDNDGISDTTYRYNNLKTHLYIDFLFNIKGFSFRIGSKMESYTAFMESLRTVNQIQYLPSFNVSKNFCKYNTVRLNFRTTNHYPSVWMLTPYVTYSADSLSANAGNVKLKPQTLYSVNATYIFRKGGSMLQIAASYGHIKNLFGTEINISPKNIMIKNTVNLPGKNIWSLNILYSYDSELFSAGCTFNPFYEYLKNFDGYRKNLSYGLSVYNYWYLPLDFEIDIDFSYKAKVLTANGYFCSNPEFDIYVSKSFWKNNIKLMVGYSGLLGNKSISVTELNNLYEHDKYISGYCGFLFRFVCFIRQGKSFDREQLDRYNDNDLK